ncbi:hypothetical protein AQUSIP_07960 [Aquicella siphonis]|uniref:Uncharacterized protein n=1 Tax=Aquicella siphonis TaxID=254247 RepID=A0A5E4PGL4_9COXI|nr:hypothetical protein [Aquicella siphonis]VVC75506.1 hypothetical protein AQUSIP_07960 [Aquicella siphonis]
MPNDHRAKKDLLTLAIEKNPCSICRANRIPPPCKGHGGGGGGSSGGSSESDSALTRSGEVTMKPQSPDETAVTRSGMPDIYASDQSIIERLTPYSFDSEMISDLLSRQLLSIDHDADKGILRIQSLSHLLSESQKNGLRQYINTILKELQKFRHENGIQSECHEIRNDRDGHFISLTIALPSPALHQAFIQKLAEKNLLPKQNIHQEPGKKIRYPAGMDLFRPEGPLNTRPSPGQAKRTEPEEENEQQQKWTPFKTRPLPKGMIE